jgi:integrase
MNDEEAKRFYIAAETFPDIKAKTVAELLLPHRSVHSLRHTNITMQIAAGVPLVTVAGRAGHARTSTTTDIYSHFLKSSDKAAARMLESVFEQAGE